MPDFKFLDEVFANHDQWESWSIARKFEDEMGKASKNRSEEFKGLHDELEARIARAERMRKENLAPQSTGAKGTANLAAFHAGQSPAAKAARQAEFDGAVRIYRSYIASQKMWMGTGGVSDPLNQTVTVAYDNDLAQELTRVEIIGGKLYMAKSKNPLDKQELVDTAKMASYHSGPGVAIYVMSKQRNLHIHSHVIGGYHHSSLLHGAPVFGAGELKVNQGTIELLTNKSGHYAPKRESLYCVLSMLQNKKVPLEFAIAEHCNESSESFPSVLAFMKKYYLDDDGRKELSKSMEQLMAEMEQQDTEWAAERAASGAPASSSYAQI